MSNLQAVGANATGSTGGPQWPVGASVSDSYR